MIPFSDQKRQIKTIRTEIDEAVKRVIDSGWFILGKELEEFEQQFGQYCDNYYAVGVGSGTEALHLALVDAGVKNNDEVITVPNTAVPTVSAIYLAGATPVFADIDENTYLMDTSKIEPLITKKTKAIVPVHLYGQTVDMDPLLELAEKYNLKIVEDACQAHSALYKGKKSGTIGDYGCFSFYPSKNLGAFGDAGAIVVKTKEQAEKLIQLRNYGQKKRYYHEIKGFNSRLDELQAAILKVKLKHLDEWTKKRNEIVEIYKQNLKNTDIILPKEAPWSTHVYHLFVIRVKNRDIVMSKLEQQGIKTLIHYPLPIPLQSAYNELKYQIKNIPIADKISKEILSLPIFPELEENEILEVCKQLKS